jgi:predicted double-glycine peptidase
MNKLARNSPNPSSRLLLYTIIILSFSVLGCGKYLRQENSNGAPSIHAIQNLIRIPLTRQAADYTCGAAALQSILYYYGQEFQEDDLVEKLGPTPERGTKYPRLVEFAQSLNFRVEVRTGMTLDELKRLMDEKKPVILLIQAWPDSTVDYAQDWDDGHYAIAIGYDQQNVYFMDPSTLGHYTFIPVREFLDRWHDQDGQTLLYQFGMVIWKDPPGKVYNPGEVKRMR